MDLFKRWRQHLDELREAGRYRTLTAPRGIDFSSNDYLGYARQPPAESRVVARLARSGAASRLLRGHHPIWDEVESRLAAWHGAEASLMFTSGYSANEGVLGTLIEPGDVVASDQLNHASLIDGVRLALQGGQSVQPPTERFIYGHQNVDHLESGLRERAARRRRGQQFFVVTESLFSMDGDRTPLAAIADICERYDAHLIVDEAHATGCFGPAGSGRVDELQLRQRVLATVHTGGKALGVAGAYVCGSKLLRELLVNRCRHLIFTTALPPAVAAWWLEALERVQHDQGVRQKLHANAALFRAELARRQQPPPGLDFIVPVVLGDDRLAMKAAAHLQELGYDIRAIRPPTVPTGSARLRISIHADHETALLKEVAAAVAECTGN